MKAFVLLIALAISAAAQANELRGRVVAVSDGDTITVLDANQRQHKIRFNGIDAPESQQDFGQTAKRNLSHLIFGKDVAVTWSKIDRYGRIVGTVKSGGQDINLEQLRAGLAWYFRKYESDVPPANRRLYDAAEAEARRSKRGLWQQPNPTPPWDWRAQGGNSPPIVEIEDRPGPAGRIIGNKNSMIYHRSDCPDYAKVSEKNQVYFNNEAEAERAGYRKARNCP